MNFDHPALPPRVSVPWLIAAAVCWLVVALVPESEPHPLPEGRIEIAGTLLVDVTGGRFGDWALVESGEGPVLLEMSEPFAAQRGDKVIASGVGRPNPGSVGGVAHRGVLKVRDIALEERSSSPVLLAGRAVRGRVVDRLQPLSGGRALLAGFLVGDISGVDEIDEDAMRKAGLSHFTAVSGSNVALFLGFLFVLAGPLGIGPKRRAVVGLLGLPVYAAATAFEPSVLRASVMAGIVLVGRLAGFVLEAWQLLAAAIIGLLLLDSSLVASVGFQLSVAATAGVLIGSRWPTPAGWIPRTLAITVGAQAAVAPFLVVHFGQVPLLSPLINLVAAPIVTVSTLLGGVGVLGFDPALSVGAWLAEMVLELARGTAAWPQVGGAAAAMILLAALLILKWRQLAPLAMGATVVALSVTFLSGPDSIGGPGIVVLDVGQGDAILLDGSDGSFGLVDGGPDPVVLLEKLAKRGVQELELVVLTHVHADHATGLEGLIGRIHVAELWVQVDPHETGASRRLLEKADEYGVPMVQPPVGHETSLGGLRLKVEGPLRRYASPNDQSIVIQVSGAGRSALLSGDIETVAQGELSHLRTDVLKVPHQGAATSHPDWLARAGAEVAVISVGPNQFGHPAPWVVDLLAASGAEVLRTDIHGDVVIRLDE